MTASERAVRDPAVALFCTDQGQHGWTLLGDLGIHGGLLTVNENFTAGQIALRRRKECVWIDGDRCSGRVQIRCPRCRRHVPWRGERAAEIVRRLATAGVSSLDISFT
jgi:hypothetical protein